MNRLRRDFFYHEDVTALAEKLIGKWLISEIGGIQTEGIIIETEAYKGAEDRACHAYQNRKTKRTEVMFENGGVAYVYLCYGIHNLLNIVTNRTGIPHAILIRALHPTKGLDIMKKRRNRSTNLTNGPGNLCQAMGISQAYNGHPLDTSPLYLEERESLIQPNIQRTKRIGIDYAGPDADLLYRFVTADC